MLDALIQFYFLIFYSMFTKRILALALAVGLLSGSVLPAFAHDDEGRRRSVAQAPATLDAVQLSCMQSAVGKREGAIGAAFDAFAASVKAAFEARKGALNTAWGNADKEARREAIRAAWKNFRDAKKTARRTFDQSRRGTWKQFKEDRRTCNVSDEGGEHEGADAI